MSNERHYSPVKEKGTGSACCKLILAGEHLVVYGYPGLAVPLLDKVTTVELIQNSEFSVTENGEPLAGPRLKEIENEIDFVFKLMTVDPDCLDKLIVNINYGADPGIGLGVSASFAVALIRAVSDICRLNLARQDEIPLAELIENRYHGIASGLDHLTVIHEQPILWKGENGNYELLDRLNFSETKIWQKIKLKNTGRPTESTKDMISYVKTKITPAMHEEWSVVSTEMPNLVKALMDDDQENFKRIINFYGKILEEIPIVNEEVKLECLALRARGGACKICGAGGVTEGSGALLMIE